MKYIQWQGKTVAPSKLICVGRNYAAHAAELGNDVPKEPIIFCKPNSAISDTLASSHGGETLHFETEISFLIQNNQIAAVGLGLDLTKRTLQNTLRGDQLPWERCKAFDGSAVFSEFIDFEGSVDGLSLKLFIDDELVQNGGVDLMIFKPQTLIENITEFMSLEDNDIIMTGTPAGVGAVNKGATFKAVLLNNGEELISKSWVAQ